MMVLRWVSAVFLWALVHLAQASVGRADFDVELPEQADMHASAEELRAWQLLRANQPIAAREFAEKILRRRKGSYVAHLVLGHVQHYAEGNFPRALFHLDKALKLYEQRHGAVPGASSPWRWHSLLLRELGAAHYVLEHYQERLVLIDRYNEYYRPLMIAERAWPLMKLRRFKEARQVAQLALSSGQENQESLALNALCAIEFEAGHNQAGYVACKRAVEHARQGQREVAAVDLSNLAEASRSLFRLDDAERTSTEATKTEASWYANPWLDLTELYTRQGRYAEALAALKHIGPYKAKRPPHVRDADRAEVQRAVAAFLLVVGRVEQAREISSAALHMPDRRAHTSRDEEQDRAIVALLDRRANRMLAELERERAVGKSWPGRLWAWTKAQQYKLAGWASGRRAVRLLAQPKRLIGTFQIGTSQSAIMPPWLVSELVEVLGAGVVSEALTHARSRDQRPGSAAYYTAFEAEVALEQTHDFAALRLAKRALRELGPSEVLLRTRVSALAAEAARRTEQLTRAGHYYDNVFQSDPGVFRRLGIPVAVRYRSNGSGSARQTVKLLERSPRFVNASNSPLMLEIRTTARDTQICLAQEQGTVVHCSTETRKAKDDTSALAARAVKAFHEQAFSPRLELSQVDINSLDGSNVRTPDALHTLFDQWTTGKW